MSSSSAGLNTPLPLPPVVLLLMSSGLTAAPSISTGAAFMAGVLVSMSGVCVTTAGEVLCENVPDRDTGEMGASETSPAVVTMDGETGVGFAMMRC